MLKVFLAKCLETIQLAHVSKHPNRLVKNRRFFSPILAFAGNCFFDLIGEPLRFLCWSENWANYEIVCWRTLHGLTVTRSQDTSGSIELSSIVGQDLLVLLKSRSLTSEHTRAAGKELKRVHSCILPDGRTFSHADPQLSNLLLTADRCMIIDFETLHSPKFSEVERQVDDCCCFLLDLISRAPEESYLSLVSAFFEGYSPLPDQTQIKAELQLPHSVLMVCRRNAVSDEMITPRLKAVQNLLAKNTNN